MTIEQAGNADPTTFELHVADFLNPELTLSLEDQLETMSIFWHQLGHELPAFDQSIIDRLTHVAETNPALRIMPAPLLDLEGRATIIENAKAFRQNQFSKTEQGLWIPSSGTVYGELLPDPTNMMMTKTHSFPLVYRAPQGSDLIVGREPWIQAMTRAGKLTQAYNGTSWTAVVIDANPLSGREPHKSPGDLFSAIEPSVTPETMLGLHLLQHVSGTLEPNLAVNFVNEAVGKVRYTTSRLEALVEIAGVRWYGGHGRVRLGHWVADYYGDPTFGTPVAYNAL